MFTYYWQKIILANPKLKEEEQRVKMSVSELKRLLEKSYEAGRKSGYNDGYKAAYELNDKTTSDYSENILKDIMRKEGF